MLHLDPLPLDREALTTLLRERAERRPSHFRHLRDIDRLVTVLVFLRGSNSVHDLFDLTARFPNNPEFDSPSSPQPLSRVLRWMERHGVVERRMLGYQLCYTTEQEFGTLVLKHVWGRR